MMKWTIKQKKIIKHYYRVSYQCFRFMSNGEVQAKRDKYDSVYGVLYTKEQSKSHLQEIGVNIDNFE